MQAFDMHAGYYWIRIFDNNKKTWSPWKIVLLPKDQPDRISHFGGESISIRNLGLKYQFEMKPVQDHP